MEFRTEWKQKQITFRKNISKLFPALLDSEIHDFATKYFAYASGLYPICNKTQIQKESYEKAGISLEADSFANYFEPILVKILEDLHN